MGESNRCDASDPLAGIVAITSKAQTQRVPHPIAQPEVAHVTPAAGAG